MVLIIGWERLGMEFVFVSFDLILVILKFMYFSMKENKAFHYTALDNVDGLGFFQLKEF
jgi:hypothetical protein